MAVGAGRTSVWTSWSGAQGPREREKAASLESPVPGGRGWGAKEESYTHCSVKSLTHTVVLFRACAAVIIQGHLRSSEIKFLSHDCHSLPEFVTRASEDWLSHTKCSLSRILAQER